MSPGPAPDTSISWRSDPDADHEASSLPRSFPHRPALDGLRAVAVGAVIAYHFGAEELTGGFLGVDLFFVLSGYLITSLLLVEWGRTSKIAFGAFWARRARRLLPALVLLVGAVGIWSAFAVAADRIQVVRNDGVWTLLYGANWHFIASGQSYFDLVSEASPFRHMWSLAIEEQFYLVWPLVAFGCLWLGRGRTRVFATVCVAGLVASAATMSWLFEPTDPSRAFYGTDSRAHGLLIGALLAMVLARHRGRAITGRWLQVLGIVAAAACVVAFAAFGDHDSILYPWGFLAFELACAGVVSAIVQPASSPLISLLSIRPIRWVGAISYGLYLWHWPVQIAISEGRTRLVGWELAGVRLAVTFAIATLSFYLLELPIRRGTLLRGKRAWIAAPAGLAVGALVLVLGTQGAEPPPRYVTASPNKVLRTEAPEVSSTTAPPATPGVPAPVPPPPGPIVLIGDSVADTLAPALAQEAALNGVALSAAVRPGCGVMEGIPLGADGVVVPWGGNCSDRVPGYQEETIAAENPAIVVWLSTWETADRIVGGETVALQSPRGTQVWTQLMDQSVARLSAGGAKVLLVELPAPAAFSERGVPQPGVTERIDYLNKFFRHYARERPNVGLVDLASIVCPDGPPCPETRDGVTLRPRDGGHFSEDGARWVAPFLFDEIARAAQPNAD